MNPGAKKLLVAVVAIFLLFMVVTQPQQSAGMVRDLLGALRDGGDSWGAFLRSLTG
ncbi:MAG: hypothetical protein ACRDSN_05340 [Pseudonocardiaceae bacterium]